MGEVAYDIRRLRCRSLVGALDRLRSFLSLPLLSRLGFPKRTPEAAGAGVMVAEAAVVARERVVEGAISGAAVFAPVAEAPVSPADLDAALRSAQQDGRSRVFGRRNDLAHRGISHG